MVKVARSLIFPDGVAARIVVDREEDELARPPGAVVPSPPSPSATSPRVRARHPTVVSTPFSFPRRTVPSTASYASACVPGDASYLRENATSPFP